VISPAETARGGGGDRERSEETGEETRRERRPVERIAMAETAWLVIGRDGAVYTTQFDGDGTYRDYRNGEFLQSGTWRRREDGLLCFSPAKRDRQGACWETQGLAEDGTMPALDPDGRAIELRRVSYRPPQAGETEETGADDEDGGNGDAPDEETAG